MNKKTDFIRDIKPIAMEKYIHIDNDRLVLYSVNLIEQEKIETTFDNVVVATFKLFPTRFSLIGFPEYPDAKRIHDCLFHCTYKTKNWLFGNAKSGYFITDKGKSMLTDTKKKLSGEIIDTKYVGSEANRKEKFFLDLIKSDLSYKKYTEGNIDEISEQDIRRLLRVSSNTTYEILEENFNKYNEYAKKLNDNNVKIFLGIIEKKMKLFR
jgi:hypothetical protein